MAQRARPTARSSSPSTGSATHFFTQDGVVKAVDGVSFAIGNGETLGVVGESGCGKSITALSVMRLIERPGRIVEGIDPCSTAATSSTLSDEEMRDVRGNAISMIFQEPMTSLNPVYTCGDQIARGDLAPRGVSAAGGDASGPSRCSARSASRTPSAGPASTRTSSRAACASA